MNYLQYCQGGTGKDGILYIQGTNLPSTGDPEKDKLLLKSYQLYLNDLPLSGTDPIGELWVEGAVLGKPLLLLGKGLKTVAKPLINLADEQLGKLGLSYFKNKAINTAVKEGILGLETNALNKLDAAVRLGKSSSPNLIENSIQHTLSFNVPTTAIKDGKLIPTPKNGYMGSDKIWWTTEEPYQKGADVIIQRAEQGSGATSKLEGGFARDASWRLTSGAVETNGMVTSVKDPISGIYTHTDLTPGTYTASKGHAWYTFNN